MAPVQRREKKKNSREKGLTRSLAVSIPLMCHRYQCRGTLALRVAGPFHRIGHAPVHDLTQCLFSKR
jgi:hypothetical protein